MKKIITLGLVLGLTPILVFAVTPPISTNPGTIGGIMSTIGGILAYLMPILVAFAVVYFVWGIIQYTMSSDEEKKKKSRDQIIKGLIGLFIIIAFWGIIGIVMRTFNIDQDGGNIYKTPCVPTDNTSC